MQELWPSHVFVSPVTTRSRSCYFSCVSSGVSILCENVQTGETVHPQKSCFTGTCASMSRQNLCLIVLYH